MLNASVGFTKVLRVYKSELYVVHQVHGEYPAQVFHKSCGWLA